MGDLARNVRRRVSGSPFLSQSAESTWTVLQKAQRGRKIRRYVDGTDMVRVMIGAGPTQTAGWLATDLLPSRGDVVFLDAGEAFPFDSASVDRIHTEHMIEHVDHEIGARMLAECFRVLKPGGRIRVATPDFDKVIALAGPVDGAVTETMVASNGRNGIDASDPHQAIYAVNRLFSAYGHRFLYTESMLRDRLSAAGFTGIVRHDVGASDDPEFAGLDSHDGQIAADWNRYQTVVLEAERP